MDNLGWAQELVAAPDLEAAGSVIHRRLTAYTAVGAPQSERALAERLAFEHQTRHYMGRAQERGFEFARRFEFFASRWVTFVDQNKTAETELTRLGRQHDYERGRTDAATAAAQGWTPIPAVAPLPVPSAPTAVGLSDAVHQTIDAIVKAEVGKHVASLTAAVPANTGIEPTAAPLVPASEPTGLKLSQALKLYLAPPGKKRMHKTKGRADTAAVVQFAVDFFCDPVFDNITMADGDRLDEALTDIPHTKGLPGDCRSLFARYRYAQDHGWEELTRVTITTVEKRYHYGLDKFLKWAGKKELYRRELPKFICIDEENKLPLPRDAFENKELIALISLALFTGCAGINRIWTPGKYLVQSHIYWGYLVMMLTGMRPGEIGPLACADIVTDGENYFFDLRPFNARNGRVALKDVRDLKSNSAGRVVPIHPLFIELGLLDRMHELETIGEKRLFPEWEKFTRGDGTVRWSQPLTKSWQHVKTILQARADVTLYSLRHLVAEWLDNASVAQRTRDRILGHAGNVPGGYGRKGMLDAAQVAAIHAADPPVIQKMREILLPAKQRADRGELAILKPWLTARGA